jgi:hypothetical protein
MKAVLVPMHGRPIHEFINTCLEPVYNCTIVLLVHRYQPHVWMICQSKVSLGFWWAALSRPEDASDTMNITVAGPQWYLRLHIQ